MTETLRAEGVSCRIGDKTLVRDVTLTLAPGRVAVVVGPNGAGKSTLVRLLSGELRPVAGKVLYDGTPVRTVPPSRLACLRAVLPQASRLAFPFRVREIVRIGQDGVGRGLDGGARAAIVAAAMDRADVAHLAGRNYQTLSGGEQQRVQFARILAQLAAGRSMEARQVLFLDEPIASLDLKHQLSLLESAASIAQEGVAVLAVLHDLNLAATFADEMIVMQAGRVVAAGSPVAIFDDRVVSEVFGVDLKVGEVPADGRPFVLPRRLPQMSG